MKLEQLILSGNQLTQLVPYQFPPLAVLQKLDLSHNILTEVSPKSLLNLGQSVRTLDLRGNLLASLHGQLLMPLYKIQVKTELSFRLSSIKILIFLYCQYTMYNGGLGPGGLVLYSYLLKLLFVVTINKIELQNFENKSFFPLSYKYLQHSNFEC